MTQDELKQAVAREAIKHVVEDAVIGVGTGSTANFFIDELASDGEDGVTHGLGFELAAILPPYIPVISINLGVRFIGYRNLPICMTHHDEPVKFLHGLMFAQFRGEIIE